MKYSQIDMQELIEEIRITTKINEKNNKNIEIKNAEDFLRYINNYSKYCTEDKKQLWKNTTSSLIYSPLVLNDGVKITPHIEQLINESDIEILDELYAYLCAGEIMEKYNKTKSWNEIDKILDRRKYSRYEFEKISDILIEYSSIGVNFIEKYDIKRLKKDKELQSRFFFLKRKD